jgi:hypothetical protein
MADISRKTDTMSGSDQDGLNLHQKVHWPMIVKTVALSALSDFVPSLGQSIG